MSPALRFRRSAKRDAAEGPARPKRGASRSVSRRQPVTPKSSHQISSHSPNELIAPDLSRQSSSSNLSSEVAPEIVVWTEDMDLDSPSQDDSDILSDLDMSR